LDVTEPSAAEVVDLAGLWRTASGNGVLWSLVSSREQNVNLVRLEPGAEIGEHVNNELEVVLAVLEGSGEVIVNGVGAPLQPSTLAFLSRGARRAIRAGPLPLVYLSMHRRREGLRVRGTGDR
jgi:quercetin dioxygenase-like cupin family protein